MAQGSLPGQQIDQQCLATRRAPASTSPDVTMPVLNIFALEDHIIPPATSRVLDDKIGTNDYTELGLPGGHIGLFVSGKSQGIVGTGVVDWLSDRDT